MHKRFGRQAQFLLIYLREAHATDGWSKPNSELADPRTQADRDLVAAQCCQELEFDFPALVDTMDDRTAVDWAAWPERIFVIGVDGRVAYRGEQGPWGFWPTERVRRQAAEKFKAKKGAKGAKGKTDDVPVRNYDGDSLETFLARMLPGEAAPQVVEPRITRD